MTIKKQVDWKAVIKERGCRRCPHSDKHTLDKGILNCARWEEAVTDRAADGSCNVFRKTIETRIAERAMTFHNAFKTCDNPKFNRYVDELCECGHLRSEHNDVGIGENMPIGFVGHGSCLRCACQRYRWESFMEDAPEKRIAFFIMETRRNNKGEYNALIAVENERGYYPTDWYWGADKEVAQQICDERNERLGLDRKEAMKIQTSTMRKER